MASELLKTFQKIESGRKLQIEKANNAGHSFSNNASFIALAGAMQSPEELPKNTNIPEPSDWVRPTQWVDGKEILRNAEVIEDMYAGAFLMFKTSADSISIPIKNNSSGYCGTGCDGFLMCDGTWYNDTSVVITHTWDTNYAITIEDGEYAGTYYWCLAYYKKTSRATYTEQFGFGGVCEIILGVVNGGYASDVSTRCLGGRGNNSYGSLINFEILPESNITQMSGGSVAYEYHFNNLTSLRHIDFGSVTSISTNSSASAYEGYFFTSPYLKELDLTGIKFIWSANYSGIHKGIKINPEYLKTFKSDKDIVVTVEKPLTQMNEFYLPNGTLRHIPTVPPSYPLYVPENDKFVIGTFQGNYPINWSTPRGADLIPYRTAKTTYSTYLLTGNYKITSVELNSAKMTTSPIYVGDYSPALKEIIVNKGWNVNLYITWCDITHDSLVSIIDNLYDYSGTTTTRTLKLGYNLDKLSEDEIKIATDKGWGVIE